MSHIVQIQTQVRDAEAVRLACRRLHLPEPINGSVKLFGSTVKGLAVQLPGWSFPVVVQPHSGQVHYYNRDGKWGDRAQLDRFLHAVDAETAKSQGRNNL